jgi:hypothetical protein
VRECAGQINMLLTSLVLGEQHIHAASSAAHLEPDLGVQQSWGQAAAGKLGVGAAAGGGQLGAGPGCSRGAGQV